MIVSQDLDEADTADEAATEAVDPEIIERRRLQEAEEWRLQQLRSGASDENPNLQASRGAWAVWNSVCTQSPRQPVWHNQHQSWLCRTRHTS